MTPNPPMKPQKAPAYQWYPGDHGRDTALQMCSFGARALWREMLDLMHEGEPRGHLTAGGIPISNKELAQNVRQSATKIDRWLNELESRNVFSRTEAGVIFSRRMVRDEHNRRVRAAGGHKSLENPNVPRPKPRDDDHDDTPEPVPERIPSPPSLPPSSDPSFGGSIDPSPAVALAVCSLQSATAVLPPGGPDGGAVELRSTGEEQKRRGTRAKPAAPNWTTQAGKVWEEHREGVASYDRIGRALKPLITRHGEEKTIAAWETFCASDKAQYGAEYFARNFGDFSGGSTQARGAVFAEAFRKRAERLYEAYLDSGLMSGTCYGGELERRLPGWRADGLTTTLEAFRRELRALNPRQLHGKDKKFALAEIARLLRAESDALCEATLNYWLAKIGAVDAGRFRSALMPMLAADPFCYEPKDLVSAVEVFREGMEAPGSAMRGSMTVERFAGELHKYARLGAMELVDQWGETTERGVHAGVAR